MCPFTLTFPSCRCYDNDSVPLSPPPHADSGRGVSRPNSQIDVVDLRVSRTESVGKKSVQSVVSDQGALSEEGKHCTTNQIILEGT